MAAGSIVDAQEDLDDTPVPTLPAIQGQAAPQPQQPQPQQPLPAGIASGGQSVQGPPLPGMTPGSVSQGGIAQGTGNAKGEIQTPEVTPEYDPKKLAKAQNPLDLLNAMKPASRTEYMDWWEKQHGDIDDKYDALKAQLGARPSEEEPQTKKEKFAALLEFGLHLMKASAPASTNQGEALTGTLADSIQSYNQAPKDKLAAEQQQYDQQSNAIENARASAQQGIGSPADAMKAQLTSNRDDAQNLKDTAIAYKDIAGTQVEKASAMGPATYATGPGGVIHAIVRDADGHAHAEPVTGIDGKPFAGRVLGRSTGSGVDKASQDPAAVRTHKYLINVMGMDPETAARVAFKPKTGDPNADHAAIYKAVLSSTLGDADKAKRVADQYVLDQYGAKGVAQANAPMVAQAAGTPPPQALNGLKPGMVRDFGANGKWTVGIDGKPQRVGAGPQTIQ